MKFSGAIERAVARVVALIPLLLVHRGSRDAVRAALEQQLSRYGWADASSGGLSSLKRDLRLLRELELVVADAPRRMPTRPGPRLPLWVTPDEARAIVADDRGESAERPPAPDSASISHGVD